MEDSLEDYIRISRNQKQNKKKDEDVRKNLAVTLQKKKESEMRAMKIVEFMIEGKLRVETFLRCLLHINQEYYQDIVEERALNKLCGYSLCGKKLPKMPSKKYHISAKQNKVYDITDRKNYCSNFCYKASIYIKKQIETSPLWLRNSNEVPNFKLLPPDSGGLPGEEIDQGIAKPVDDPKFVSFWSFTEASLDEMVENEIKGKPTKRKTEQSSSSVNMDTINEDAELAGEVTSNEHPTASKNEAHAENVNKLTTEVNLPEKEILTEHTADGDAGGQLSSVTERSTEVQAKKEVNEKDSDINNNKFKQEKKDSVFARKKQQQQTANHPANLKQRQIDRNAGNVLEHINKSVQAWISTETYFFLFGQEKIAEVLNEKQMASLLSSMKISELKTHQQIKYLELCRKLHMKEVAEEMVDRKLIGKELKPLPDYEKLKEESKMMDLKVRCFYQGMPYELDTDDYKEKKTNKSKQKECEDKDESYEEGPPAVLPLADVNSQKALRRKVFLNSLNKVLQNLAELFHFSLYDVQSEVKSLVKTFNLEADNVVFKPIVWNIVAIVILKILSIKKSSLKEILETARTKKHIEQIMKPFPNGTLYLNDLTERIENLDFFVYDYLKE